MSDMTKLSHTEIINQLQNFEGWTYNEKTDHIEKEFQLKGYYKTIAFVNYVAWLAQKACHHPDLLVTFGKVKVSLTTHDAGGISPKDFSLVNDIESGVF